MIKGTRSKTGSKYIDLSLSLKQTVCFPDAGSGWFGLYLVTGGACVLRLGREKGAAAFTLEANTLLCLDDSIPVRMTDKEPACEIIALYFEPTFLNVNMEKEALACEDYRTLADRHGLFRLEPFLAQPFRDRVIGLTPEGSALFNHYLFKIGGLLTEDDDWYWSCRIRSHVMDILSVIDEIRRQTGEREPDSESSRFASMTAYVRGHIDAPPSVEEMTTRFDVGRNRLQACFHRYAGCSYLEYVQNVRLEHAKYCLRFTELSIPEIASHTGFRSTHNFSRFFKAQTGESATEYRVRTVAARKQDFLKRKEGV